jgi:DNA-binding winged helix-turn-helix (wHTH) protein/energy-coupling factor transporter ATP-binding protein EcfA2
LLLGPWLVDGPAHRLVQGEQRVALEPLHMAVLLALCERVGRVVSADELLAACWRGEPLGDNPVHKAIAALRRALGDSATTPQYIETIRKQGYRLISTVQVLGDQGPRGRTGAWTAGSPFRGLEAFEARHAAVFFGRDPMVATLLQALNQQWQRHYPLVVLLGPSGSGKSSLVQAGLLPALHGARPADWPLRICADATLDGGSLGPWDAFEGLAAAMLDWEVADTPLLSGYSISSLGEALRQQPAQVAAHLQAGLQAPACAGLPAALVLDRWEALLASQPHSTVAALLATLDHLLRATPLVAVVVCRNDHYAELARHEVLMAGKVHGAHVDLLPPDAEALAQIIRLPAQAAGLHYGLDAAGWRRLDDRLVADAVGAPDALPLLQYTLAALYEARSDAGELRWAAYDDMGGLDGAIGRRAEAVLAALPEDQQAALPALLGHLVQLAGPAGAQATTPSGRWMPLNACRDDAELALLRALVEARLLVTDQVGGRVGFRVAHEALLRRWPRVTTWVAQHQLSLSTRDELHPWVQRWREAQGASAYLLPQGPLLSRAREGLVTHLELFTEDERQFVQRSVLRHQRKRQWRWAAVAASVVLAAVTSWMAVHNLELAHQAQARERESQRLSSFMLGELADQLRPLGKLDLLGSLGEQGLAALAEREADNSLGPTDAIQRAKALLVLAEVQGSRGKGQRPLSDQAAQQARQLLQAHPEWAQSHAADYWPTLGAAWFWLGQNAYDAGELDTAAQAMGQYRQVAQQWVAAEPKNATARTELGSALGSLGAIAIKRARWAEAQQAFEEGRRLAQAALADEPDNATHESILNETETWLGVVAYVQGQPVKALEWYEGPLKRMAKRASTSGEAALESWIRGGLLRRTADARIAMADRERARQDLQSAAAALSSAWRSEPSNANWEIHLVIAKAQLALLEASEARGVNAKLGAVLSELSVATSRGDSKAEPYGRAKVLLGLLRAKQALETGDASTAIRACDDVKALLDDVYKAAPDWQLDQLRGQLALIGLAALNALNADAERQRWCEQMQAALAPALASGHAGVVLEASLHLQACAGSRTPSPEDWQRLSAGGYRVAWMSGGDVPLQSVNPRGRPTP